MKSHGGGDEASPPVASLAILWFPQWLPYPHSCLQVLFALRFKAPADASSFLKELKVWIPSAHSSCFCSYADETCPLALPLLLLFQDGDHSCSDMSSRTAYMSISSSAKQAVHDAQTECIAFATKPPQLEKVQPSGTAPSSIPAKDCTDGMCSTYCPFPVCLAAWWPLPMADCLLLACLSSCLPLSNGVVLSIPPRHTVECVLLCAREMQVHLCSHLRPLWRAE